jgi:spore germination cell wall hydrolase CwlJ-like protein
VGGEKMTLSDSRAACWHKALLALVTWREAEGETMEGKLGVANSIHNRVLNTNIPDNWSNIIAARHQYSSMTFPGNPRLIAWPQDDEPAWHDCMEVAERVITLQGADNTFGAVNYCNLDVVDPPWAHTMRFTVKIGKHSFFAERNTAESA